jgi:hypothetical protein
VFVIAGNAPAEADILSAITNGVTGNLLRCFGVPLNRYERYSTKCINYSRKAHKSQQSIRVLKGVSVWLDPQATSEQRDGLGEEPGGREEKEAKEGRLPTITTFSVNLPAWRTPVT